MRPNRATILALLLLVATHANAERTTRYFELVNATYDSVTSLAVAPVGSDAFRDIEFDAPLHGGLTSTTMEIPDGDCLRDIRVAFNDGRVLLYAGINVCRYDRLRLTPRDGKQG